MSSLLQADIFFFITSVAVICVTAGVLAVLYYLVPLVRDARDIVARLRKAGEDVEKDFTDLRMALREEGAKSRAIVDTVLGFVTHVLHAPARRRARSAAKKKPSSSPEA